MQTVHHLVNAFFRTILGKSHRWLLCIIWLIIQISLLRFYGVKIVNDSGRYVEYAQNIATYGYFETGHNLRYVGYCLFISSVFWLGGSVTSLIITQIVLSGLAAIALYAITRQLSGSTSTAALATWLFILWPDIQYWNCFVLTESFFTSFLLFSFAAVVLSQHWWQRLLAVFILFFTATIRPNGFIVVIAAIGYVTVQWGKWMRRHHPDKMKGTFALLLLLVLLGVYWLLDSYLLQTFGILGVYENGWIIYGWDGFVVLPDKPLVIADDEASPIRRLVTLIGQHPFYFVKIFFLKVLFYVGYLKPYYSVFHNVVIVLFIYPLYYLAGKALMGKKLTSSVKVYLLTIMALHVVMIALTYEDWDCRFLIPVLPLLLIISSVQLTHWLDAFTRVQPTSSSKRN